MVVTLDNSDTSTGVPVSVLGPSDGIGAAARRQTLPRTINTDGDHDR
jgi:hypothetical protein